MHIGLIGLPQSGKKTLLRLLTGVDAHAATASQEGLVPGICSVRDPRLERLAAMYHPQKLTPATIQYLLMPDLTNDSAKNQELFKALAHVDVVAAVIRAFADDTVFHLEGSVNPHRDLTMVQTELLLNDLLFVEKRLERLAKEQARRSGVDRAAERELLATLQAALNDGAALRTLTLGPEQPKLLSGAPLLTSKPLLVILNVGETQVRELRAVEELKATAGSKDFHAVRVSAKIEEELSQLNDPTERAAFLKELGIVESAIDGLTRVSYDALGLISYFTVGTDEVRAWTVRRGASAAAAARIIHSDLERGFIRAELIKYDDLMALGSEHAVANSGKAYLKGRDYLVEDGDILNFRFNV